MKIKLLLLSFALISFVACNQGTKTGSAGSGSSDLNSEIDSISYILGADIGDKLKQGGIEELNMVAFSEALIFGPFISCAFCVISLDIPSNKIISLFGVEYDSLFLNVIFFSLNNF